MFKAKDIVSNLNLTLGTFKYLYRWRGEGIVLDIFILHQKGVGDAIHEHPVTNKLIFTTLLEVYVNMDRLSEEKLDC